MVDLVELKVEGWVSTWWWVRRGSQRCADILYSRVGEIYKTYLQNEMIDGNRVVKVISGRVIERTKASEGKIASCYPASELSPASLGQKAVTSHPF